MNDEIAVRKWHDLHGELAAMQLYDLYIFQEGDERNLRRAQQQTFTDCLNAVGIKFRFKSFICNQLLFIVRVE